MRNQRIHRVIAARRIICCSLSLAVIALVVGGAAAARDEDDRFAAVPKRMEEFIAANRISGAVVLVGQHGKVVHLSATGLANLEEKRPMTTDTMFRIMSMTKPMTTTAVMILQDQGKLSVDDPVEKYIPSFANAKLQDGTPVKGIKIRHLLSHTSGLIGEQKCEKSLEATAEMLAARPFGTQPGEKWVYGPGLNVCGRIIEVVSGEKYQDFLAKHIFQPLEMKDTTFYPTPAQLQRLAVCYAPDKEGGKQMIPSPKSTLGKIEEIVPSPSGGLFSTAGDVFRFYQTILDAGEWNGHRIVSADAVKAMTSLQTGQLPTNWRTANSWGLGWCLINRPQGASTGLTPGSFGHGGLYGTQVWLDPSRQAAFILMIQSLDFEDSDSSTVRREFQRLASAALDAKPSEK